LTAGFQEGEELIIRIADVSQQTLVDLRTCLFAGGLPAGVVTSCERLLDLAIVAQKYEILYLLDACTVYLSVAMSRKNVCKLMIAAEKYRLSKLLKAAVYFAVANDANVEAVKNSDDMNEFSSELLRVLLSYISVREKRSAEETVFQRTGSGETYHTNFRTTRHGKCFH